MQSYHHNNGTDRTRIHSYKSSLIIIIHQSKVADNTKKETKLATIDEDGEQLLDNVSGGMMINEGDKQDQTFGDYMNKKDADKKGADN